uniref:Uncharacterized protein LOC105112205 n=1 Tax=Rhizophora mucronata TaxID=61149 RepID=A0A2P2KWN1_RHIMU
MMLCLNFVNLRREKHLSICCHAEDWLPQVSEMENHAQQQNRVLQRWRTVSCPHKLEDLSRLMWYFLVLNIKWIKRTIVSHTTQPLYNNWSTNRKI